MAPTEEKKDPYCCDLPEKQGRHTYPGDGTSTHVYWCQNCNWGRTVKKANNKESE